MIPVKLDELDDPPGYFRNFRTGRVHLVRSVTRVMHGNGAAHQMVIFVCTNMANGRQGALLTEKPPDVITCAGCLKIRYRKPPRVQE